MIALALSITARVTKGRYAIGSKPTITRCKRVHGRTVFRRHLHYMRFGEALRASLGRVQCEAAMCHSQSVACLSIVTCACLSHGWKLRVVCPSIIMRPSRKEIKPPMQINPHQSFEKQTHFLMCPLAGGGFADAGVPCMWTTPFPYFVAVLLIWLQAIEVRYGPLTRSR